MKLLHCRLLIGIISLLPFSASAENYALIMGISEYQRQPLAGVKKDFQTAVALAASMDISLENMTIKKDQDLTLH